MKLFFVNQYFFTITPSRPVQIFVSDLKKQVRDAIGCGFQDEFSPVHISIFKYNDQHANNFLYDADSLLSVLLPLEIQVKGLGIFKHGANRTIYLQTEYKTPVADLASALGGEWITPHIIIARNLNVDDFEKAWGSLQEISYNNHFRCTNVTVLKKEHKRWNKYLELPLPQDSVSRAPSLYREPVC